MVKGNSYYQEGVRVGRYRWNQITYTKLILHPHCLPIRFRGDNPTLTCAEITHPTIPLCPAVVPLGTVARHPAGCTTPRLERHYRSMYRGNHRSGGGGILLGFEVVQGRYPTGSSGYISTAGTTDHPDESTALAGVATCGCTSPRSSCIDQCHSEAYLLDLEGPINGGGSFSSHIPIASVSPPSMP